MTGLLAKHPGICPLCCHFIAKGRSHITALDVPLPPSLKHVRYDSFGSGSGHGWFFHRGTAGGNGNSVIRARSWVHVKCAAEIESLSPAELRAMAQNRSRELRQHKDAEAARARKQGCAR
jgi:hypothetical protein